MATASRAAASFLLLLLAIVLSALASRYCCADITHHRPVSLPLSRMQEQACTGNVWLEAPGAKVVDVLCRSSPRFDMMLQTYFHTMCV